MGRGTSVRQPGGRGPSNGGTGGWLYPHLDIYQFHIAILSDLIWSMKDLVCCLSYENLLDWVA